MNPNRTLLLAGVNEFVRSRLAAPSKVTFEALSEAYTTFGYDLGVVSADEAQHFIDAAVPLPKGFVAPDTIGYKAFKVDGGTVGVILLPELRGAKEPTAKMLRAVLRMCKEKRKETDLLVGLSPWGYWGEQAYLKTMPKIGVDILLGSGAGVEVAGAAMAKGRIWWNRAFSRGKYVLKIDVDSWPERVEDQIWSENENIHTESIVLTDGYVEDIDTLSIIAKALN